MLRLVSYSRITDKTCMSNRENRNFCPAQLHITGKTLIASQRSVKPGRLLRCHRIESYRLHYRFTQQTFIHGLEISARSHKSLLLSNAYLNQIIKTI
jgi:hypothetical protein